MKNLLRPARRRHGFSLVEVLVATAVALSATLAIFQTFAASEGYRRSATSGGDANFAGALGAYLLEQDLSMAGYGINSATYLGCPTSGIDSGTGGVARNIAFNLAPVQITAAGAANQADTFTVVASNSSTTPGPIPFNTAMGTVLDNYQITNPFGVTAGDLLVLAQPGLACTLVQATDTPTANAVGSQNTVTHASTTYRTTGGTTVRARYNPAGGIGPVYGATAVMMDMGPAPVVNTYYILNNTLMVDQLVTGQIGVPVAANIVQLKALYGRDTVGAGTVTTWDTATPATAAGWSAVLAARIALVARSAQPEKANAQGACTTTTALPSVTWEDGTVTVLDVSATANWQCFRYKVFHATASLRNQIWTPS